MGISDTKKRYSQVEDFVVLGGPVGVLGLGLEPALLVGQMGPDQVHLHVRLERLRLGRLQVVSRNN